MLSIQTSFSNSSREVAMDTILGQNWRNDLHLAPWHFKMDWNNMDEQLYSANDPCTNLVNFGPVTPEITV